MEIRKAAMEDLPVMMGFYDHARRFMAEHGNPTQWGTADPSEAKIKNDIQNGHSYLCVQDGKPVGTFYFNEGPDSTYAEIRQGQWLNDRPYSVVHRVASGGTVKGVGAFCLNWTFEQCGNLRIDTHRDNQVMQNLLTKLGFQQCGIVTVENGTERIVYQKTAEEMPL